MRIKLKARRPQPARTMLYGRVIRRTDKALLFQATIEQPSTAIPDAGGCSFWFPRNLVTVFSRDGHTAIMAPVSVVREQLAEIRPSMRIRPACWYESREAEA